MTGNSLLMAGARLSGAVRARQHAGEAGYYLMVRHASAFGYRIRDCALYLDSLAQERSLSAFAVTP